MAKNMARLENNTVVNVEWVGGDTPETDTLKDVGDRLVAVGDTYDNGKFYRDGVEVLTLLEEAQARIAALNAVNADQAAALTAIYNGTTEVSA